MDDPKTIEQHFVDWESAVFGFGYGTGEEFTIPALKAFMANVGREELATGYDYRVLEKALGATVAWLLINILCGADLIEYGTSPRGGWLTKQGEALKAFVDSKSERELIDLVTEFDENYVSCLTDHCNCGRCAEFPNPFWTR